MRVSRVKKRWILWGLLLLLFVFLLAVATYLFSAGLILPRLGCLSFGHHGNLSLEEVTVQRTYPQFTPQWTPDDSSIVFGVGTGLGYRSPKFEIYVAGMDGHSLLSISDGDGEYTLEHSPSLAPDGSRIAYSKYRYVGDDDRYVEIEMSKLDGTDKLRLTEREGLDFSTAWSQDDGHISFMRHVPNRCVSFARTFVPVVARIIESPCGPVCGLLSLRRLRVNHLLSIEQRPVG